MSCFLEALVLTKATSGCVAVGIGIDPHVLILRIKISISKLDLLSIFDMDIENNNK